jgi:hypothetical protein
MRKRSCVFGSMPRSRRQRRLEEFRRQLHHVMQGLAPFLARLGFRRGLRQRHSGHRGQTLHGLGEAHPLGLHHETEDVAVFLRREIEPRLFLVIDVKGRRFLLVERRQPPPLAPGLLELHAPADHLRNREAGLQVLYEIRRKAHGDSGVAEPTLVHIAASARPSAVPRFVPVIHRAAC